eukprot:222886-Chlamydomonas_euryale.AAC.4
MLPVGSGKLTALKDDSFPACIKFRRNGKYVYFTLILRCAAPLFSNIANSPRSDWCSAQSWTNQIYS